jgi:hypothetical protein
MKIIDIDPATKPLTDKIHNSSIRIIYDNGDTFNYKINNDFKIKPDKSNRKNHPYIKDYLNKIDTSQNQQALILNPDGTERYGPIKIPAGKLAILRLHTRQLKTGGVDVYIKLAVVDKKSQQIHKVRRNGTNEIFDHSSPLKINLLPEELSRL